VDLGLGNCLESLGCGTIQQDHQRRVAAFEGDRETGQARPGAGGGRERDGVDRARLDLSQRVPHRTLFAHFFKRHELEKDAVSR